VSGEQNIPETITIEDAQNHLAELIAALIPGEEIVIIQNDQPVAGLRALFTKSLSRASAIAKAN
jgi:antitoxin (DNA-binding transcriptional repressor) of toxin-antitoxin stability system